MAQVMKKVDAVIVGFGWTGAIMAKELTEAGLHVVALERGPARDTYPDGVYPQTMDELTYNSRKKLFMDISRETVTLRHSVNDLAVPYRQFGAFLPGTGTGGQGCTGQACTFGSTRWNCACAAITRNVMARLSSLRA